MSKSEFWHRSSSHFSNLTKNSPKLLQIGGTVAKICSIFWRKIATSGHSVPGWPFQNLHRYSVSWTCHQLVQEGRANDLLPPHKLGHMSISPKWPNLLDNKRVLLGLIHKAYKAKADGTDFHIWGTGKPLRQFIYSLDLAKLFVWAIR